MRVIQKGWRVGCNILSSEDISRISSLFSQKTGIAKNPQTLFQESQIQK
jgi:hypothetical protein